MISFVMLLTISIYLLMIFITKKLLNERQHRSLDFSKVIVYENYKYIYEMSKKRI